MLLIVSNVVFCGIEAEILSQKPERAVEVGLDVAPRSGDRRSTVLDIEDIDAIIYI